LLGADYSEPGAYFITICAAERRSIFGAIGDGKVTLSALGRLVQACWLEIPEHFSHASIKEFVVMPNHLHGIVSLTVGARYIVPLDQRTRTPEAFERPVTGSIPTIVRTFKAAVSREARKVLGLDGHAIWQRNYFECVLRDGGEYKNASRYILENPMRWGWDRENPQSRIESSGTKIR
jgi:putative transposase